ncbi:cytochrome P450 [Streptomyces sp. NPDC019531]|uniref:cytochrome P450 n=1 Tax=Streptomyces sp. NPDC019531 TaxID=3365062 RepID=UPI00384E2393
MAEQAVSGQGMTSRVIDLTDPGLFLGESPDGVYAELRRQGPLWRNRSAHGPDFWAVVRHQEIVRGYADSKSFSSVNGIRLGTDPAAAGRAAQRMLIVSDPPTHTGLRGDINRTLGPAVLRALTARLHETVRTVLDQALQLPEIDFVSEVASRIPEDTICQLLGVPETDRSELARLTTQAFESPDEQVRRAANAEVFLYFDELVTRYRHRGTDDQGSQDVVTVLAASSLDTETIVLNCAGLLAGGNETTRHAISGGLLALTQFPDQFTGLGQDEALVDSAVEELLRWTTPAVYVLRNVVRPVELGGVELLPGEQVALWNASGNRDEAVFPDPGRLDLARFPNRQLAFGHGRHTCIGARLARLEIAAFLSGLRTKVGGVEITGTPEWNGSNFARGLRRLPVRLIPR